VKKQSSNKNALAQIHFTYLQIPEIPKLGQNSFLCPAKRQTNSEGKLGQRLESHPSDDAALPPTIK